MHKYGRIVYWSEEEKRFLVEVPEFPGCMSDGLTVKEAIGNVDVVIEEWIETAKIRGQEIPEPRGKLTYV